MKDLFTNKLLWIPIFTWLLVQTYKFIRALVVDKKLDFRRIFGAGGFPSAHTACISSLATSIGLQEGLGSSIFALSAVFTFIVMYDAAGVRRAAGKQAKVLNQIIESEGNKINVQEKLVELLGHTPFEVFGGLIVGVSLGIIFSYIW